MLDLTPPAYFQDANGLDMINDSDIHRSQEKTEKDTKVQSIQIYPASELWKLPKRQYLIKYLLDIGGMSVLYGASNSGKTFVALDIALSIAMSWSWQGHRTKGGVVVYIACEGEQSILERMKAFCIHHDLKIPSNFFVIPHTISFSSSPDSLSELFEKLFQIGDVKLIIVDTLARAMAGGDENSASDMGLFIQNCDVIRKKVGAHLMVIHHSGKDQSRGARGSNSLQCAIDTEISVKQNDDRTTRVRKGIAQRHHT